MNLRSLDPDIIGVILSFWAIHNASLQLWLTGDKPLQRKIASGATTIHLFNTKPKPFGRVPLYLLELRRLREIYLDRRGHELLHLETDLPTLKLLPQGLVTLQLNVKGATRLLFPVSDSTSPSDDLADAWSIKTAFPVLESLHLSYDPREIQWTASMFSQLPDSLTSLQPIYQSKKSKFVPLFEALPSNIRIIQVFDIPIKIHKFLALIASKELTEVSTETDTYNTVDEPHHIKLLPRTLTSLQCGNYVSCSLSQEAIAALPPSLTEIIDLMHSDKSETLLLEHLPRLTRLEASQSASLRCPPETIKRLPRSIRTLSMVGDINELSKSDWPPHLSYLDLSTLSPSYHDYFDCFPSGLTKLLMHDPKYPIPLSAVSLLPRTLRTLRIVIGNLDPTDDQPVFPPHLEYLNISGDGIVSLVAIRSLEEDLVFLLDQSNIRRLLAQPSPPKVVHCFPFHTIPRCTESLYIMCPIPASQLVHLPPRISTLWCLDVFEDTDFNPQDPQHLTRMAELYEIGSSQGIVSPASHVSLPASTNSLMPRTLTSLTIAGDQIWNNADWSRLPPCLDRNDFKI